MQISNALKNLRNCKTELTCVDDYLTVRGIGQYLAFRIEHGLANLNLEDLAARDVEEADKRKPVAKVKRPRFLPKSHTTCRNLMVYLSYANEVDLGTINADIVSEIDSKTSNLSNIIKAIETFSHFFERDGEVVHLSEEGQIQATNLISDPEKSDSEKNLITKAHQTRHKRKRTQVSHNLTPVLNKAPQPPGNFELILIIDNREKVSFDREFFESRLSENGVRAEKRNLSLGDFAWVLKHQGRETMLDYIIERKDHNDFMHSIMDGRFKEQALRLKTCGLQNPLYLVEGYSNLFAGTMSVKEKSLRTAVSMLMAKGLSIFFTTNCTETVKRLTQLHQCLQSITVDLLVKEEAYLSSKEKRAKLELHTKLHDDTRLYKTFQASQQKEALVSVSSILTSQIKQINGMSFEKVLLVLDNANIKTPTGLREYYKHFAGNEKTVPFENLVLPGKKNKFGRKLATSLRSHFV